MVEKVPFEHEVRVYYEDTDAAGYVYHSRYLNFAERARSEVLLSQGLNFIQLVKNYGGFFVVRTAKIDYLAPGKLNDKLVVKSTILEHKGARVRFDQAIYRGQHLLCDMKIETVFVNEETGKPMRIPARILKLLGIIEN